MSLRSTLVYSTHYSTQCLPPPSYLTPCRVLPGSEVDSVDTIPSLLLVLADTVLDRLFTTSATMSLENSVSRDSVSLVIISDASFNSWSSLEWWMYLMVSFSSPIAQEKECSPPSLRLRFVLLLIIRPDPRGWKEVHGQDLQELHKTVTYIQYGSSSMVT